MAKKESRRVKTLSSFMKWAEQFEPGLYLFRGISNEKYPIQASAYRRLLDKRDQTPANLLEINKRIIDDARLQGHDLEKWTATLRFGTTCQTSALRRSHLSDRL